MNANKFTDYLELSNSNRNIDLTRFVFDLLSFGVQVQTWHLQTGQYEIHMTLSDLYRAIPDEASALAETIIVSTKQKLQTPDKSYTLIHKVVSIDEIVNAICAFKNTAVQFFNDTSNEVGINNSLSEIIAMFDRAIYKLTQLR